MTTGARIDKDPDYCRILANLQEHFVEVPAECPYGLPYVAIYRQARFGDMLDGLMAQMLFSGYRRNGNVIYAMCCMGCTECVPIRLHTAEFRPNRNQRRVARRNIDLAVEVAPLEMNKENLALLDKFLKVRYPGRSSSAVDYYAGFFLNNFQNSLEIRFRSPEGELLGVSIIDLGRQWLNAVYFYFDPDAAKRSLGTYNILYLVDFCRQQNIDILYLGYWIKDVPAMKYKEAFRPHELLVGGSWISSF
ncbi:MAG: arginyltransferase [Proteobacteria bacterium]|nr:arginyltransferase [Pseudomonadota bacterium]MBU1715384.1 arginyltransferase [Pseudomonadota bacterium]